MHGLRDLPATMADAMAANQASVPSEAPTIHFNPMITRVGVSLPLDELPAEVRYRYEMAVAKKTIEAEVVIHLIITLLLVMMENPL